MVGRSLGQGDVKGGPLEAGWMLEKGWYQESPNGREVLRSRGCKERSPGSWLDVGEGMVPGES